MKLNNQYFCVNQRFNQAGFSLVELMVGLVIGLLATLAIMQMMGTFDSQKRTTTGTADAQTNGNIALYSIARDIQSAGYGLMFTGTHDDKFSAIDCTSLSIAAGEAAAVAGMTGVADLTPVTIVDGGATGSDSITIRSADNTSLAGLPSRIINRAGSTITIASNLGCKNNDFVLINNAGACAMTKLDAVGLAGEIQVILDGLETVPAAAAEGAVLSCLGNWRIDTFAVNGGNLQLNGADSVADIVNMQAQYGVSASANSNKITSWVSATGGTYGTAMTVATRNRIKAVRVAVVSRNPKAENADVSASCSFTTDAGLVVDLSGDANCKRYHYSVYETIIPLRNMIWSKDPPPPAP